MEYTETLKLIMKLIKLVKVITSKINQQNQVGNGYNIISELENVLQCGCYRSILDYDNID